MASGNLKGIYRQRKKAPTAKPSSSSKPKPSPKTATSSLSDPSDGYGEEEEILRQFDLDLRYGPCLGMTRMARWERASRMGLDPPAEVEAILRGGGTPVVDCVWDGRI